MYRRRQKCSKRITCTYTYSYVPCIACCCCCCCHYNNFNIDSRPLLSTHTHSWDFFRSKNKNKSLLQLHVYFLMLLKEKKNCSYTSLYLLYVTPIEPRNSVLSYSLLFHFWRAKKEERNLILDTRQRCKSRMKCKIFYGHSFLINQTWWWKIYQYIMKLEEL